MNYNRLKEDLLNPKYRPDIDGLRAIAVLSVVGFHAFPQIFKGGFIGVDIFFVISGFLISTILFQNLENNSFSFRKFYSRRILRIFPALVLILIFCVVFGWFVLLADEYMQLGKHISGSGVFVSNFILWNESGYFDNQAETKPLLHLWSLGIEEQFYIFWPFLLWITWKKKLNLILITGLALVGSFLWSIYAIRTNALEAFYSPQTRFWELLCGTLLAWLLLYKKKEWDNFKNCFKKGSLENILSCAGLLFLGYGFYKVTKLSIFPGLWVLSPILGAFFILLAGEKAWINRLILSNRLLVGIGLISFPLYLWHWPILSFINIIYSQEPSILICFTAVFISLLFAMLTYRYIEIPIRFKASHTIKVFCLLVLMFILSSTGFIIYFNDGYENRSTVKDFANNKNELIRAPAMDKACLSYINNRKPTFPYCRFTDASSNYTVAIIGDSHGHVAYPGIAEILKNKKINTVLLGNSGCPPFLGSEYGENEKEKEECKKRIEDVVNITSKKLDIKKVFIFSRGARYLTGKNYSEAYDESEKKPYIDYNIFKHSLQNTINILNKSGKQVYYVIENPEFPNQPNACIPRPLRIASKKCELELNLVKKWQKHYLSIIHQLKNVVIIDTHQGFCPKGICNPIKDGKLLYADSDHISLAGSKFQAKYILSEYLS